MCQTVFWGAKDLFEYYFRKLFGYITENGTYLFFVFKIRINQNSLSKKKEAVFTISSPCRCISLKYITLHTIKMFCCLENPGKITTLYQQFKITIQVKCLEVFFPILFKNLQT